MLAATPHTVRATRVKCYLQLYIQYHHIGPQVNKCSKSTCHDGKLNGDEVLMDCGGSCAQACTFDHTVAPLPGGLNCSLGSLEERLGVMEEACNTSHAMWTSSVFPSCDSDLPCAVAYVPFYDDCETTVSALYKSRMSLGEL